MLLHLLLLKENRNRIEKILFFFNYKKLFAILILSIYLYLQFYLFETLNNLDFLFI